IAATDRAITTVEGLASGPSLSPLQRAFAELGAAQCGYCTPAMLLTAQALLDRTPHPTREDIRDALSGTLCRCTGYLKIFEAVELTAAQAEQQKRAYRVIGTPRQKVDAAAKVTGALRFADDLVLPRMLHCTMLRASLPHARIVRIDTTRAAALAGVVAVLTGEALPIPFGILPITQDEHALCIDRVRFVGDPVAAVAAVDEDTARAACDLIDVEYEALPSIGSIDQGLTTPEPQIHDYADEGNVHKHVALDFGGVDEAMRTADLVREDVFFYEGNTHLAMEQHAAMAEWSTDGRLTLWTSTQTPHYVHRAVSKVLQMPPAHVRVIATPNGGGFGG